LCFYDIGLREFSGLGDPVVLVAVSLVLLVATMMPAAIPANRAASIQPVDALRID
jgi:ABC-type lipoprotein release transport system permease subunit